MKLRTALFVFIAPLVVLIIGGVLWMLEIMTGIFIPDPKMEVQNTGTNGVLRVVTDKDYWPYSFIDADGNLSGREIELATMVANELGMKMEIVPLRWEECIDAAVDRKVDLVLTCADTSTGRETDYLRMSIPTECDSFSVFGKKPIGNIEELKNYRVGLMKDGNVNTTMYAAGYKPYCREYPSYRDVFEAMDRGEIDYTVTRYNPGIGWLKSNKIEGIEPQLILESSYFCLGVDNRKPELFKKIDNALAVMRLRGDIDRLNRKWLSTYVEPISPRKAIAEHPMLVTTFLLVAILFLVALVVFAVLEVRAQRYARLLQAREYAIRRRAAEAENRKLAIEESNRAKDQILSEITQSLYGFNITINLDTEECSVIRGTGMDCIVDAIEHAPKLETIYLECERRIPKEQLPGARKLLSLEAMRDLARTGVTGFAGSVTHESVCEIHGHHWHELNLFLGVDEDGHPVANILARDVTENHMRLMRESLEREAAAAKDRILSEITQELYGYNLTVNLRTLKYTVITGTGMDAACEVFKSSDDYAEAIRLKLEFVAPRDREKIAKLLEPNALKKMVADGVNGAIGATVYEANVKGEHQWHETNVFIGKDASGDPIANILGRDITEERREQERKEREREAVAAKDRILSGITQALYGYNLTVNLKTLRYTVITGTGMDAACEIFKSTDDYPKAIKLKLAFVLPKDRDRIAVLMDPDSLKKMVREGADRAIGSVIYEANVNGAHQWHETNVFIGVDRNGDPIANILGRDVTQQHTRAEAEAQLLAAQQANKAKTAFLFSMSHDIRTPMNAILGFTDIARNNIEDRERVMDCLEKTKSSGELLLSLINSILDMSRIESGKAKVEETEGDVVFSFENIKATMQELAKAKGISLEFEIGKVTDRYVYADYDRCNRVFVNIISNAIKYSRPNGHVWVKCEQTTPAVDGRAFYNYTFRDDGIGMSEEFLEHIFEEFARERNSTTSGIQGTGLGMSLCKSFVELMGGSISCRSKQGVGTTFSVTIPFRLQEKRRFVDPVTRSLNSADPNDVEHVDVDLKGRLALLVEDNELNREVAEYVLKENGIRVETAADGSVAVRMVKEKGLDYFDFILMDIQMPIMGGYEATKIIRTEGFRRPIIALSANAFAEDKAASIAAGMDDHVAKPIKISELLSVLAKHLSDGI